MKSSVSVSTRTLAGKTSGIQIQLAVGAATAICVLLSAGEVSAQPTVPGFTVETYASDLYRIERISLDSSGVLYAGTDHGANQSRIYRVGVGGFPVEEFGPALWDPDAVFVDVAGTVSGIPGSVVVGGVHEQSSGQGYIGAILPDESFQLVHAPTSEFENPQEFAMDSTGRLLFVDYARNSVYWSDGLNFGLLFNLPARPVHISVDSADRIFTYTWDETIRIHDANGNYIDDVATGLTPRAVDSAMAIGPGGVWGTDLYVINGGALLRIVADPGSTSFGETTILGTGFDIYYPDMVFGPDGGLYVNVGSGDAHDILRISPICNGASDVPYAVRETGGILNGVPIDDANYEITLAPGEPIEGAINVRAYYSGSAGAVVPFGYTVDWGLRENQAVLINGNMPHAPTIHTVPISKTAPTTPGDYHIIIGFSGRYTIDQVMSETKQDVPGNPIWYDGNDVGFDWTSDQLSDALFTGTVRSQHLATQGYSWGCMGATAVVVHVIGVDCNGNGIPDDQDITDCDGSPWCSDCNNNEIPDECDIADGTSADCQPNGIPDECEVDRVLFEDDFADGLSQWTIVSEGDNTYNGEIVFGEGNPEPALLVDDLASYHCFANSNTTFSHVGRNLEISVDFKHGNAASGLQRHASFRLTGLDGLQDHDFYIVGMSISASTNPRYPNVVNCSLRYDDNGVDEWETSGFLPIPSGDGWHTGRLAIQPDGIVDFYLDGALVYTSMHQIISRFDGEEVVQLGSRRSFYDNVRVVARGENDCNNNAIPDECDIESGFSEDNNSNGIPDECEPICGDGNVDPGEQCDDENASNNDDCLRDCTLPTCGDGFVWNEGFGIEQCDGMDDTACPGACLSDCTCGPTCGNGTCDPGEDSCNCPDDCGVPPSNEIPGATCADGSDNDCDGLTDFADPDCSGAIPTISEWGLAVMVLLLLAGAKVYFRRSLTPQA